ncbi:MAG: nucleotidyltransferase domain-containing protein, partial [Pseudomonadota bacterium]
MVRKLHNYSFIQNIQKLPFVRRVILYGSRARRDNKERSDIDLAVDCTGATDREWFKVINIVDQADTLLKIDCVRFDKLLDG